jgi:hypothetical protein
LSFKKSGISSSIKFFKTTPFFHCIATFADLQNQQPTVAHTMEIKPEELEQEGYVLLDKLEHQELVPFIRKYINTRTLYSSLYVLCNSIAFALVVFLFVQNFNSTEFSFSSRFTHLS